jgi:hypothetical protein
MRRQAGPSEDISKILVKGDGNLLLLQTNNANQRLFNDYLKNGKLPSRDQIKTYADRNLRDVIQDCERFVSEWLEEGKDLMALLRLLRNRLGFVVYDTDDNTIVYSVFEVLNSRGLRMNPFLPHGVIGSSLPSCCGCAPP